MPVACGYNNATTFEIRAKTDNSAADKGIFTFVTSVSNSSSNNMWISIVVDLRLFCTKEEIATHKNLIITVSGVAGLLKDGEPYSY